VKRGLQRRALIFLGGLKGERHMSSSGTGSDFNHYRCLPLFRLSEPVNMKSEERSWKESFQCLMLVLMLCG